MKYQHTESKEILTYHQLKAAYPTTSLAPDGSEMLMDFWHVIATTARPGYDVYTQGLREIAPVGYVQTWDVFALSAGEVNQYIINAKEHKYAESEKYSESLVDDANSRPYGGAATTSAKNKRRMASRVNQSSNGKPKNGQDKNRDEALAEYTDATIDAQDIVDNMIDGTGTASGIYAINVETAVTWPSWTPPV